MVWRLVVLLNCTSTFLCQECKFLTLKPDSNMSYSFWFFCSMTSLLAYIFARLLMYFLCSIMINLVGYVTSCWGAWVARDLWLNGKLVSRGLCTLTRSMNPLCCTITNCQLYIIGLTRIWLLSVVNQVLYGKISLLKDRVDEPMYVTYH